MAGNANLSWPVVITDASVGNGSIYYVTVNVPEGASLSGTIYPSYRYPTSSVSYPAISYPYPTQTMSQSHWDNIVNLQWYQSQPPMSAIYQQPWLWDLTETPEEKAKREEREVKRKAAEKRAESLLFTILTPTQVKQYTDDHFFDVAIKERIYRLRKGRSMNVELIEAGKAKIKFCAHPADAYDLPVPDVMLSQLLMLRADEQGFLDVANRTVLQ